jgi:cell division protein ZapA
MKTTHQVTVLGRELPVRSSAPPAKVQAVETLVNSRLHEIGSALRHADAQLLLSLTLLNMAEELLDLQATGAADAGADDRLRRLIRRLDELSF